jgi:TM2 domain-containing membrane protein YozV
MLFGEEKSQKLAVILAIVGAVTPFSGLHKFYLRQPVWGMVYLFLSVTLTPFHATAIWVFPYFGIAQVASLLDGVWYFIQSEDNFKRGFNDETVSGLKSDDGRSFHPHLVGETAQAIRQLDQLREEGLLSEYEFEQQRRQLVKAIRK